MTLLATAESVSDVPFDIFVAVGAILWIVAIFVVLALRYKRCPPGKVMILSGRTGDERGYRIIEGGGALVLPFLQEHAYLDLAPLAVRTQVRDVATQEQGRFEAEVEASVAIDRKRLDTAATRLLHLSSDQIATQADAAIRATLRRVAGPLDNDDGKAREQLENALLVALAADLSMLGLALERLSVERFAAQSS